ncbi:hypothetical protein ACFV4K_30040 [Nocardia sp. NPDC059764]
MAGGRHGVSALDAEHPESLVYRVDGDNRTLVSATCSHDHSGGHR